MKMLNSCLNVLENSQWECDVAYYTFRVKVLYKDGSVKVDYFTKVEMNSTKEIKEFRDTIKTYYDSDSTIEITHKVDKDWYKD